jgi:hypothetical protein
MQGHPKGDCEHRGTRERVAQHHGGEQILWIREQPRHNASRARVAIRQLAHLPLAEGKERRFREREEEARPGGDQNYHDSRYRRRPHACSMMGIEPKGKM